MLFVAGQVDQRRPRRRRRCSGAMNAGRRSIIPLKTFRASSYPSLARPQHLALEPGQLERRHIRHRSPPFSAMRGDPCGTPDVAHDMTTGGDAAMTTLDQRVLDATIGALELFGIHLGSRLGLYDALLRRRRHRRRAGRRRRHRSPLRPGVAGAAGRGRRPHRRRRRRRRRRPAVHAARGPRRGGRRPARPRPHGAPRRPGGRHRHRAGRRRGRLPQRRWRALRPLRRRASAGARGPSTGRPSPPRWWRSGCRRRGRRSSGWRRAAGWPTWRAGRAGRRSPSPAPSRRPRCGASTATRRRSPRPGRRPTTTACGCASSAPTPACWPPPARSTWSRSWRRCTTWPGRSRSWPPPAPPWPPTACCWWPTRRWRRRSPPPATTSSG